MPYFSMATVLGVRFFSAEFIVSEAVPITPTPLSEDMSRSAAEAVSFLKSLSHEQRLMILCHLCAGEKSVGELMEHLGLRQATTSQMLARLREDASRENPARRQDDILQTRVRRNRRSHWPASQAVLRKASVRCRPPEARPPNLNSVIFWLHTAQGRSKHIAKPPYLT